MNHENAKRRERSYKQHVDDELKRLAEIRQQEVEEETNRIAEEQEAKRIQMR